MPELPEVETIVRGLGKFLPGLKVASVDFDWPKSFPNAPGDVEAFLIGASVVEVKRRAKVLLIELTSKYSLVIHLKMTGQLVFVAKNLVDGRWKLVDGETQKDPNASCQIPTTKGEARFAGGHPNDSLIGKLPDKSTRVTFEFTNGAKLFFNDQRKFGWVKLIPTAEIPQIDFFKKVGPEPLADDFSWIILRDRLKRRPNTSIKAAILDQTVLAGIGNIYADESLWAAKIHPATRVMNVSDAKIKLLHGAIREVLTLSIASGGSTDRNYVDAEGQKGSYLKFAKVFRREGQPCFRHPGTLIEKIRVAGRGTHICPKCQKLSTRAKLV